MEAMLLQLVAGNNAGTLGFWVLAIYTLKLIFNALEVRGARKHSEATAKSDSQWEKVNKMLDRLDAQVNTVMGRLEDCEDDRADLRKQVLLLRIQQEKE